VRLRFTALPEHVRTARLVATAVARRRGVEDDVLEEVRLAVGEACARAVQRSSALGRSATVELRILENRECLVVEVSDHAAAAPGDGPGALALTLIEALADGVHVAAGPGGPGGRLRMEWQLAP
jgi:anti-sigma regulatory factor (Ser/Thr protein kinase)